MASDVLMAEFIDWPEGSRVTGVSGMPRSWGQGRDGVIALHLIDLPDGQQGTVEVSVAHTLLPFSGTCIHGTYPDGTEWLLLTQIGVLSDGAGFDSLERAGGIFKIAIQRYRQVNPEAEVASYRFVLRSEIEAGYRLSGVSGAAVSHWALDELISGMVCEMCSVPLVDVVAGHARGCSFPDESHDCTGDGFSDVFRQWARGTLFR